METHDKIRVAITIVSLAVPALAAFAAVHGFILPMDEIGGVPG